MWSFHLAYHFGAYGCAGEALAAARAISTHLKTQATSLAAVRAISTCLMARANSLATARHVPPIPAATCTELVALGQ